MEESNTSLEGELEELKATFRCGKTREESWRMSQLEALLSFLQHKEDDIFEALLSDLGKHKAEAYRDEAKLPASAELFPEPLGAVLVLSSWNFPFGLSLEPVIGVIAVGNVVSLKPSKHALAVLVHAIATYLDSTAVKVIQGGTSGGDQLLQHKWDKIFFTGSAPVGRIVVSAAAKHLTPVTLELGGKCPAIVDSLSSSRQTEIALKRILSSKFGACAGQVCIGIDYIITEQKFATTLVELLKTSCLAMFGGNPKEEKTIARIVNDNHFQRLKGLLNEPLVKDSVVYGGKLHQDVLFIEPTILLDPPLNARIMNEEIFGPLLPVITRHESSRKRGQKGGTGQPWAHDPNSYS